MFPIETILNYFLGSTTLISIYIAWKSRNSELKKTEASALEAIDSIYTKMSVVTDKKFEEMQRIIDENTIEIKNLKEQLQEYQKRCSSCLNNKNNEKTNSE
jgi:vacuolar-type H+-ATPase subunit I/STV1